MKKPLMNGPLNKSVPTQLLELVAKCLIHTPNQVNLSFQADKAIHAKIGTMDINLTQLFKRADFSHLSFNEQDSQKLLANNPTHTPPAFQKAEAQAQAQALGLSKVEYAAIVGYTCSSTSVNKLLHDQVTYADKNAILQAVFLSSGLNKIMPSVELQNPTYRGETVNIPKKELDDRIAEIKYDDGVKSESAFMSASLDYNVAKAFSGMAPGNSVIIFDSCYGKNIQPFSVYPHEKEVLLPPGKIQWESHEFKNGTHYFHAKIVAPLVEGESDPTKQELSNFKNLLKWADSHHINTDFVTPFNKTNYCEAPTRDFHESKSMFSDAIVINGHGAKTNTMFTLHDHTLITPGDLKKPYVFAVDNNYSIENDLREGTLKPALKGNWTVYNENVTAKVPEVKIGPWKATELKEFSARILKDGKMWSNIDHQQKPYLERDSDAKLVLKKGNEYTYLDSHDAQDVFQKINNNTYNYAKEGTPIFFYAPQVGKVKMLGETVLSEVLKHLDNIDGGKLVLLATCNAGSQNTTISYDTHGKDLSVTDIAKHQGVEVRDTHAHTIDISEVLGDHGAVAHDILSHHHTPISMPHADTFSTPTHFEQHVAHEF